MNRSSRVMFRQFITALFLVTASYGGFAQKESKTYQERFTVDKDAVLDINTNHADIEFETWGKEIIEITATVTLEGATAEEAEDYFENEPVQILGNSKKVQITSKNTSKGLFGNQHLSLNEMIIELPEIPEIPSFDMDVSEIIELPEIIEMSTLPIVKSMSFDYEAYKKDGEKYIKKWQKDFEKSFDEEHKEKLKEWAKRNEKRALELEKKREEMERKREEHEKKREAHMAKRAEEMEKRRAVLEEKRALLRAKQKEIRALCCDDDQPNIFYFSSDGEHKNYKIKKTIKIKMPKSTKIKMNVRHGEVKLAENTRNLNATLSYSSLWASTIDGNDTYVSASYSPVSVQKWNYGQLNTNYSKDVSLAEVLDLRLQATSSDVVIDRVLKKALIKNDFGPIQILSIANDFEEMDISLKNAELEVKLPNVATKIYVKGTASELKTPAGLHLERAKNGNTTVHKGFHLNDRGKGTIIITSDYSNVAMKQ